jgi:arylsulfatase A-like enzyme
MRPFELGCHGHEVVQTPHLDRLAAGGLRVEHAVSPNPPVHAGSIISGQHGRSCNGWIGCCGEPADDRGNCFPHRTLPDGFTLYDLYAQY